MRNFWIYGVIALGAATLGGAAIAQDKAENKIGPIDNLQDLEDTARMLFKLADTNNDGQISQKEATDAGNLLVGGFFFRADTNGDGVLSQDEARQARDNLFAQQPLLRLVLDKAKPTSAPAANQPLAAPNANDPARVAQNLAQDPADRREHAGHEPRPEDRSDRIAPGGANGRTVAVHGGRRQSGWPVEPLRAERRGRRGRQVGRPERLPGSRRRPKRSAQHGRI